MRFLADESCDFMMVRALREMGHDVVAVSEASPRLEDYEVIELALKENRILLTEDKDFGQLVFAHGHKSLGVIFLRFPFSARDHVSKELCELVRRKGESLTGSFVTVQPGRIRITHMPGE